MNTQSIHPKLNADWVKPELPSGFDMAAACCYGKKVHPLPEYELDFFNSETAVYASETIEVNIPYPWVKDFEPTPEDWKSIGFEFHDCR